MTMLLKVLTAAILLLLHGAIANVIEARSITIMNESSRRIEVHWVDPETGEMVLQSTPDILNGASLDLDSFVGHTFEVLLLLLYRSIVVVRYNNSIHLATAAPSCPPFRVAGFAAFVQ